MEKPCPLNQPEVNDSISVVLPTLNEADNVEPLVAGLERALTGMVWEAIFVDDDSEDGTFDKLCKLSRDRPNIRVIRRIGRRGLASACIEGMAIAEGSCIAVMDTDLQHDETLLPAMLAGLRIADLDLVVASRFARGGSTGKMSRKRMLMSHVANRLAAPLCGVQLSDPMSGFFVLRRSLFLETQPHLAGQGTKILLDLMTAARRPLRIAEVGLQFRPRHRGTSKLDVQVMWQFLCMLGAKGWKRACLGPPIRARAPVSRVNY